MFSRSFLAAAVSLVLIGQAQAADSTASVNQTGTKNNAELAQSAGTSNASTIGQNGNLNVATSFQEGSSLSLTADQAGTSNDMTVLQDGQGAEALVSQAGANNTTRVLQHSQEGHHIEVGQVGTDNVALVTQLDGRYSYGKIYQEGQANVVDLVQSWENSGLNADQYGDSNVLRANQGGGFVSADTYQSGTANIIDLRQSASGGQGASTRISQTGADNQATVYQSGGGRYWGGYTNLTQEGHRNLAKIDDNSAMGSITFTQSGADNQLNVDQAGRSNSITGVSTGERNQVNIQQDGDGSSLEIAQSGADNIIEVAQNGAPYGNAGIIDQTGTANNASLTQGVYSSSFSVDTATITQNGMSNSATVTQR